MGPVDVLGITRVKRSQDIGQSGLGPGHDHQVNVIRHQTVGENLQPMDLGIALEQIEIARSVSRSEEYVLFAVTSLSDMMRNTGKHRSRNSRQESQ
jgi:hypothetical protein